MRLDRDAFEIGVSLRLPRRDCSQFRLRLSQGYAVAQSSNHIPVPLFRFKRQASGTPVIHESIHVVVRFSRVSRRRQAANAWWHHAHHREWRKTAEANGIPDDTPIAMKTTLPAIIAENNRRRGIFWSRRIRWQKRPAQQWFYPNYVEVLRRDKHALKKFAAVRQNEKLVTDVITGHCLERFGLLAPFQPLRCCAARCVRPAINPLRSEEDDLLRLPVWRRCQEHAVNKTEH